MNLSSAGRSLSAVRWALRDLGALEICRWEQAGRARGARGVPDAHGAELRAAVDEAEQTILGVAAGRLKGEAFVEWVRSHMRTVAS